MLVNPCKIYVYINNKAVILLLMVIYNKNQATVSQKHTKDFSRLPVKRRRRHAFTGTYNLSAASNPRVLVENYRPKQAPNLPFGQNLPVSILT